MYQVKLFKNGNSTVMAIPEQLRAITGWKPGDSLTLELLHPPASFMGQPILTAYQPLTTQEKPPHARKTTHKAR